MGFVFTPKTNPAYFKNLLAYRDVSFFDDYIKLFNLKIELSFPKDWHSDMTHDYKRTIKHSLKLRKKMSETYYKFLYIALFDYVKGIKYYATYCKDDIIEHLDFVFKVDLKQRWFRKMILYT